MNRFYMWLAAWLDIVCGLISVLTLTFYRPSWDFDFRALIARKKMNDKLTKL